MRHKPTSVVTMAVAFIVFTSAIPKAHAGYSLVRSFAPYGDGWEAVAVAIGANIYVAGGSSDDALNRNVQIFSRDGTYLGNTLSGEAPNSVAVDLSGNVYLGDGFGGVVVRTGGPPIFPAQYSGGSFSVATDILGDIWTTDSGSYINEYGPDGSLMNSMLIPGGGIPVGIAVNPFVPELAYVAVASSSGNRIVAFTFDDGYYEFGTSGSGDGQLSIGGLFAGGLAVDYSSRVYIADAGNHRVQIFDGLSGAYIDQFAVPGYGNALAVDFTGENVYVVDYQNNLLRQFSLVPEPGSASLLALAIAALSCSGYRRFKKSIA